MGCSSSRHTFYETKSKRNLASIFHGLIKKQSPCYYSDRFMSCFRISPTGEHELIIKYSKHNIIRPAIKIIEKDHYGFIHGSDLMTTYDTSDNFYIKVSINNKYKPYLFDYLLKILQRSNNDKFKITFFTIMPSLKEIVEIASIIYCLFEKLCMNEIFNILHDDKTMFYIIGDGVHPRLGFLLRCKNVKGTIIEIDPMLRQEWINNSYDIICEKKYDYEYDFKINNNINMIVILALHSHGNIDMIFNKILLQNPLIPIRVISMPCCHGITSVINNIKPYLSYIDYSVISPNNKILAWKIN